MLSLSGNGDISHNGVDDDCDSEAQFAWNLMVGMVREWKLFSQLPRRCHSVACLVLPHLHSHPRSSHRCLQHGLIQGDNHHPSKNHHHPRYLCLWFHLHPRSYLHSSHRCLQPSLIQLNPKIFFLFQLLGLDLPRSLVYGICSLTAPVSYPFLSIQFHG